MQLKINGSHMRDAQKNAGEDGDSSVTAYVRKLIEKDTAKRQSRFSRHVDPIMIDEFLELAASTKGGEISLIVNPDGFWILPKVGTISIEPESEGSTPILEIAIQKAREMIWAEGEQ